MAEEEEVSAVPASASEPTEPDPLEKKIVRQIEVRFFRPVWKLSQFFSFILVTETSVVTSSYRTRSRRTRMDVSHVISLPRIHFPRGGAECPLDVQSTEGS